MEEVGWHPLWSLDLSTFSPKETVKHFSFLKILAVKTDEDNQSAANPGEKLQESGESSDDMNSQDAEASDRE